MYKRWIGLGALTGLFFLATACATGLGRSQTVATDFPDPTATPTRLPPTATPGVPSPTPTPRPTLTPTALPTADPNDLLAFAEGEYARLEAQAGDVSLLCVRYEDLDADSAPEWLALTHRPADPPRLDAFVLDQSTFYALEPAQPEPGIPDVGLGEYPICEMEFRDLNVDGVVEIAIFGHARDNESLLHVFAWDGSGYVRLGDFSGNGGIRLTDADGDAEEEIEVGYRVRGAPVLNWNVVHTWEAGTYGWTTDYYDWYFTDRPQRYPTHRPDYAVIAYYLALDDRDLPGAYALLDPAARGDYDAWALGYATTLQARVGGVHTVPGTETESRAQVAAMVTAWDNEGGVIVGRQWDVTWTTASTAEGWRLVSSETELLNEWPVEYWP